MLRSYTAAVLASKRRVIQQLNEKLLRSELEAIDEVVRDSHYGQKSVEACEAMVQSRKVDKARRMMGISRKSNVNPEKVRRYSHDLPEVSTESSSSVWDNQYSDQSQASPFTIRKSDLLGGSTKSKLTSGYESFRQSPGYTDLTHPEIRRVQELREKRKMLDRKIKWLKNNQLIDPAAQISKEFKRKEKEEYKKNSDEIVKGNDPLFPPHYSTEFDPVMAKKIKKVESTMERDTAIARMRTELRKEKLERAATMKGSSPRIGSMSTDPLKRHLQRRNVRVSLLLQQYLEEILSCNSAQIILDHLGGAAISIDRIESPTTRGRHDVYVRVTSEHDRKWVQERLEIVAPKLRSQLAVRVNYGYTPELKFHVIDDLDKFDKRRLMKLADEARLDVDKRLNNQFIKEMSWK